MHFHQMTADELFEAHKGHLAARAGEPLDESQPEAWKAGWYYAVDEAIATIQPSWVSHLRGALTPARELEVA